MLLGNTFYKFIGFLSNPTANSVGFFAGHTTEKIQFLAKTLLLLFVVKFCIGISSFILTKTSLIGVAKGPGDLTNWVAEVEPLTFFLQVTIIAPLLEEVAFRGILSKSAYVFFAGAFVLIYLVGCLSFKISYYHFSTNNAWLALGSVGLLALAAMGFSFLGFTYDTLYRNAQSYLLWISAVAFAFWHYNNYNFDKATAPTILIMLLPHFVAALFFSWTSIQLGLAWSIALHILNNLLPTLWSLLKAN